MICKYKNQITVVNLKNKSIFKNAVALRIEMASFFFFRKRYNGKPDPIFVFEKIGERPYYKLAVCSPQFSVTN